MANYNFEGDLSGISEHQLEFINNVIQKYSSMNSKVTFQPVGTAGDNYVASVKRITIEGETGSMSMIAKIAPTVELFRQLMNTALLFTNEHIMYAEVLPTLVQLQREAGIPEEEQLKYAKCYGSTADAPNEVILLEDLKTLNFEMLDRFEPLSSECVKSTLKNLALLHSMSYVLKHKKPEIYDNFKTNLKDMWSSMQHIAHIKQFLEDLEKDTLAVVDDPTYVKLLRDKITDTINQSIKLAKADYDSKYSVIQQGDGWTNNIMFKFEEGKLIDSIMIDYQVSKVSSPVNDIMYMIFNCTDHKSRNQYFYEWIDFYHSELEKSLSNYDLKVNYVYPKDKLDADLKRYGKLMFGLSVILASVLIRKSDDAAKVMEAMKTMDPNSNTEQGQEFSVSGLDDASITLFKNRIIDLLDSFTEFGFF